MCWPTTSPRPTLLESKGFGASCWFSWQDWCWPRCWSSASGSQLVLAWQHRCADSRSIAIHSRAAQADPPKKLDGGSYTWDSGVILTTSFRLVEKWGVRHPYCEDGSCGSAEPDDVRVILDYSVKVPKSLAAPSILHAPARC